MEKNQFWNCVFKSILKIWKSILQSEFKIRRSILKPDFCRRGTSTRKWQLIAIQIHQKAQSIIDLYSINKDKSDYLFPIVKSYDNPEKAFLEIKNGLNYFNKALKTISSHLGLDVKLSTYTARHSYATGLKMSGLSSEVIKESLGHTSVAVTEGYLKSFENTVVDEADNVLFG